MNRIIKILTIQLRKLRNEAHFGLMRFVGDLFEDAPPVIRAVVEAALPQFLTALQEEDAVLEKIRKSEFTAKLVLLDKLRNGLHHSIRCVIDAFQYSLSGDVVNAARQLRGIITVYGSITRVSRYEKTQVLFNLVEDLEGASQSVHLLGLNKLIEQLTEANNMYYNLVGERADEEAERALLGRVSAVRDRVDDLYMQMMTRIEATVVLNGSDASIEQFIARLNVRIEGAKRTLRRIKSENSTEGNNNLQEKDSEDMIVEEA